jgi:hypothetical protein
MPKMTEIKLPIDQYIPAPPIDPKDTQRVTLTGTLAQITQYTKKHPKSPLRTKLVFHILPPPSSGSSSSKANNNNISTQNINNAQTFIDILTSSIEQEKTDVLLHQEFRQYFPTFDKTTTATATATTVN